MRCLEYCVHNGHFFFNYISRAVFFIKRQKYLGTNSLSVNYCDRGSYLILVLVITF